MGLVRYIGMSTCRTAEFMQMQYYAKSKNVSRRRFLGLLPSCPAGGHTPLRFSLCVLNLPFLSSTLQQTMFISMQPPHSAVYREEERDMFLACKVGSHRLFLVTHTTD